MGWGYEDCSASPLTPGLQAHACSLGHAGEDQRRPRKPGARALTNVCAASSVMGFRENSDALAGLTIDQSTYAATRPQPSLSRSGAI